MNMVCKYCTIYIYGNPLTGNMAHMLKFTKEIYLDQTSPSLERG